ncbi:hypothetical protein UlMin_039316 [Ulmus minor]
MFSYTEEAPKTDQMEELVKIKEELRKTKDKATQSWLDSRPHIDELERRKSNLTMLENRRNVSDLVISELQSQLEATDSNIRSKKKEELEAKKIIIETNAELDQSREEMERLKHETVEEKKERLKQRQALRLKRQSLRSLQLALRAVRTETEAYGASTDKALWYLNFSEMEDDNVQLTHEEYQSLKKKAEDENSLADWRISVAMGEKLVAEERRDRASRKLKEVKSSRRLRSGRRLKQTKEIIERGEIEEEEVTRDAMVPKAKTSMENRRAPLRRLMGKNNEKSDIIFIPI